jgi:nuclear transcription factor Y, gamma
MASTPGASSSSSTPTRPFVQPGDDLNAFLRAFWQRQIDAAEREPVDVRHPALPLARIKKVMKSDPEIKVCWVTRMERTLLNGKNSI